MTWPVYAPSKIQFDVELLRTEIEERILDHVLINAIPTNPASSYAPSFDIAKRSEIEDTTHSIWNPETGARQFIKKRFNSYETINLTYLANVKESGYRNSFVQEGRQIFFRDHNPHSWRWREDIQAPHIQNFIQQLGFTQVTQVTCVIMRPPAIGLVHRDIYSNKRFYEQGYGSLSIVVASGGGSLIIDVKGEQIAVDANGSAYHFDDSYLHGLSKTTEPRYAYRVFGLIDPEQYRAHLDMDRAVW